MADAPPPAQFVQLIVKFEEGYIVEVKKDPAVNQPDVDVTQLSHKDKKKFRRSPNGLRPIETIYEATDANASYETTDGDSLLRAVTANDCYMIMGGFKIKVPCP